MAGPPWPQILTKFLLLLWPYEDLWVSLCCTAMISFTGKAGPQRKVDLRGKSRAEESREEVLEKARLQREKRQRAKLEQRSALAIQSRWRQACTAREYANGLRADWNSAFGTSLDESRRDFQDVVNRDSRCVSMLLRFFDSAQEDDRISLAVVCRALSVAAGQGTCTLLVQASASAVDKQQAASGSGPQRLAAADPSQQQLSLFRVNKLATLCLATISIRSAACSSVLSSQFSALASLHTPEAAMMEFLIKFINPETWKASIANQQQPQSTQPAAAATAGAAALLRHMYHKQLYSHLRQILQAVPPGLPGKTIGEVLVTQLAIRSISLQLGTTRTPAAAAAGAASYALQQGLCQLLFVPKLWARCRSLAPVTGRLCALGLSDICHQANSTVLLAALSSALLPPATPQQTPAGIAGASGSWAAASAALVALADNLLEALAAGSFLKGNEGDQYTAGQVVTALASVIEAERQLNAMQKQIAQQQQQRKRPQGAVQAEQQQRPKAGTAFVPGAGFMVPQDTAGAGPPAASLEPADHTPELQPEQHDAMEVDANIASAHEAATVGSGGLSSTAAATAASSKQTWLPVKPSVYSAEEAAQQQQSSSQSCFHLLAGTSNGIQLLRKLAALLLPATTAAESAKLQQQWIDSRSQPTTQAAEASIVPGGPEQQQLCVLLWTLSRPMQYRQRICLGLSVGVRLVPRLWFSYILPLHLSNPGGLLSLGTSPVSSSTAGPGGGSSCSLVQPLLMLVQAYSASLSFTHLEDFYAEAAPLLPLQQLYDSSNPGAGLVMLLKSAVWQILWNEVGTSVSANQKDQQQLKRSLGEIGGLLLCQLHDRNCTRQYCPSEAFLADIPAGRVLKEAAARGGAEGALGYESDADEDNLGFNALEQQQQWQRQRQQGIAGVASPNADLAAAASASDSADEQQQDEGDAAAVPAAGGAVVGPGNAVQTVGSFGFASSDPVQQRRQQAAQQGAPGAAAALAPSGAASRVWLVLQHAPCLIPFQERVQLFQSVVSAAKEAAADAVSHSFMFDDPMDIMMGAGNKFVTIRRDQLLDDSYSQLKAMNADRLKGRLRIAYVNEAGLSEAGIDGGGLFKDFMEELLKQGFSPQAKLFTANPQHQLYPSPFARQLVTDAEGQLQFLGRMLGKSLYEGILLELPLAAFFLKKMRGGVCDINDLRSLDLEVYTNLLQLRHYTGDFAELALNFTATIEEPASDSATSSSSSMPRQHEVELKPGGRDIPVRSDTVTEYIHRLADFRLNRQMDWAASAFLRGFFELIRPRWVRMFNEAELQMLISGSEEGIDVDDLVAHVNYAGGYHEDHPVIQTLWTAVRSFTPQQQRQFLKFVTSCSRAPLLGFAYLEPGLCVQMSGSVLNAGSRQRLPTAATCMNLLKLPPYVGFDEMRQKLLYAVTAGAGFELS